MSWPLFAVIQLGMLTIGISVAFLLRNRSLKAQYQALTEGLAEAETAVQAAKLRMTDGAERIWLSDRVDQLQGDDEITNLQKLVLQNELEPQDEFAGNLTATLAAGEAAQAALRERWQQARASSHALASELSAKYPLSHPVITQLHDAYATLDKELGIDTAELPDAPEIDEADLTDVAQEAEHVRAANELLQQEIDKLRDELSQQQASGEDAQEQENDLKSLLQQFTKDSRDMMACIQKLETENAQLRQQLEGTDNSTDPVAAPSSERETENAA